MNIDEVHRFFEGYASAFAGEADDLARYYTLPMSLYAESSTRIWSEPAHALEDLRALLHRYRGFGCVGVRVVGATGRALTPVLYQALVRYELLGAGGPLFHFDTQYMVRQDAGSIGIVSVVLLDELEQTRHWMARRVEAPQG